MTKDEIKRRATHVKPKIRAGDKVMIIAGKDKGQEGFVAVVFTKKQRAVVLKENADNPGQPLPLNRAIKHHKAKQQGERSSRLIKPMPIHISNLMVIDPVKGVPTRVGRRVENGQLVRYAKKSDTTLEIQTMPIPQG
jgi:large subunit ribosomal protein L24